MSSPDHQGGVGRRAMVGVIALVGVCGVVLWGVSSKDSSHAAASVEVGWIQYQQDGQVVRLEGSEAGWRVVSPYQAEADREVIGWMREAFLALEDTWAPLPGAVDEVEVYGLADRAVALTGGLGAETVHDWRVGDVLLTGEGSYVASAEGVVGTTEAHWANLLALPIEDLRDHRAFDIAPRDVRRVTVLSPSGVLSVSGEGKDWWLRGYGRADPSRVDAFVMGVLDIRLDGWDGETEEPSEVAYQVEVAAVDGRVQRLLTESLEGPEVGVWSGRGVMGWIRTPALALVRQGPGDIGIQGLWSVNDPSEISVSGEGFDRRYHVREGVWSGAEGGHLLDPAAVEALLGLQVDYGMPPRPAEMRGCDVRIGGADGEARMRLSRSKESGLVYATDQKGGQALPLIVPSSEKVWELFCTRL